MQQTQAQSDLQEPKQDFRPATTQYTDRGYPVRPQAIPAPAPADAYAFAHAPFVPGNPSTAAAAATPPPAKKSRFSLQRFKRNSAVVAH